METIKLAAIFSILFLFRVENSLARPGQDIRSKKNYFATQIGEGTIENKILKGVVKPSDNLKIGEIIFDALSKSPDHVSQIDDKTEIKFTFNDIKSRSIRLAVWMKELGIKPNDIIIGCSVNQLNANIPFFATLFVDATYSAWKRNINLDEARRLIRLFAPKVIFSDQEAVDTLLAAANLENVDVELVVFGNRTGLQSFNDVLSSQTEEEIDTFSLVNEKSPKDTSLILLTSGSTGHPKGVVHSGESLSAIAKGGRYLDPGVLRSVLWCTPNAGISGLRLVLQTIVHKNVQVVASDCTMYPLLKTIEKYNIDIVRVPVPLVSLLAKSNSLTKYNLQSLKVIMLAGAKFHRPILEQLQRNFPNVLIQNTYGSTETGETVAERTPKYKHTDSVGFAAPNVQIKIVDLNSHVNLGPNETGEIYVKSPATMIGYYKNPDTTRQVLDAEGWYHTGDVGKYVESGEIFILGRIKDLFKYKNHLVIPSEIESVLLSHPDIQEAVIVAIPNENDGNWPAAFVQKVPGSEISSGDLMKLTSVLEDYKQLRGGIYFLEKIPYTITRKVAKPELVKIAEGMANEKPK